jgi:hypothetical protein
MGRLTPRHWVYLLLNVDIMGFGLRQMREDDRNDFAR